MLPLVTISPIAATELPPINLCTGRLAANSFAIQVLNSTTTKELIPNTCSGFSVSMSSGSIDNARASFLASDSTTTLAFESLDVAC